MNSQPIYLGALGYLALVLVGLVELAVGVWFLKMGLWPKRQGETPHCSKCGYNLTGLASERCPECGRELASGGTVHGERRRSPAKIIIAGCFMLPAVLVGAFIAGRVDWYRLAPTFLLVSDLQSSNPTRAWNELDARIKAGKVSAGQRSRIIDVGLKEQVSSTISQEGTELLNQLGKWVEAGLMSKAQEDKFYEQILKARIRVCAKAIKGDCVPMGMSYWSSGPRNLDIHLDDPQVLVDGKVQQVACGRGVLTGRGGGDVSIFCFRCDELGQHTIEARQKVSVFASKARGTPLRQWTLNLKAGFEVVEPAARQAIRLKPDPTMKAVIQQSIRPGEFEFGRFQNGVLTGRIAFQRVPTDLAFDSFVRIAGKEYPLGHETQRTGGSVDHLLSVPLKVAPFTKCDVILRSSEKVARETVDMEEIWQGELVYPDVPVKLGPHAATSTAAE